MYRRKLSASTATCILVGGLITLFFMLLGNAIMAVFMLGEKIDESAADILMVGTVFFGTLIGSFVGGKFQKGKYGIICGIVAAAVLLLQIATNIIFFKGTFQGFSLLRLSDALCLFT